MRLINNTIAVSLIAASFLSSNPARADFWSHLVQNAGDVATFGQAGRDRDKDSARRDQEREERLAEQKEADKKITISQVKLRRDTLESGLRDLGYFYESSVQLDKMATALVGNASVALEEQAKAKSGISRLKRYFQGAPAYEKEVLAVMREMVETGDPSAVANNDLTQNRENMRRNQDAIRRLEDIARANGLETNQMINSVVANSFTQTAEEILSGLKALQANIKSLEAYAGSRITAVNSDLQSSFAELKKLGVAEGEIEGSNPHISVTPN